MTLEEFRKKRQYVHILCLIQEAIEKILLKYPDEDYEYLIEIFSPIYDYFSDLL